VADLSPLERARNDTDYLPARRERPVREGAHEPDAAPAINEAEAAYGQRAAQFSSRLGEDRLQSGARSTKHANPVHFAPHSGLAYLFGLRHGVPTMTTATDVVSAAQASRLGTLWRSAIGKKFLMAVTGIVLFFFVLVHMIGNLQAFKGAPALDHYAELLRVSLPFLWFVRGVLLVAVFVHALAGIQLWLERQKARPIPYQDFRPVVSSTASRTMIWSGLLILGFVVFHLLDLTIGVVHPNFQEGRVYQNLVASLSRGVGVAIYLVAMVALGFHLWHGLWAMFQSLGVANRSAVRSIQKFAIAVAVIVTLGFAAIPIAVILGLVPQVS
jgi:succinate dehydrogenase / fumarate reductase cytochrome b subunit